MKIVLINFPWYRSDFKDSTSIWGVRAGSRWAHFANYINYKGKSDYIPFPHYLATASALLKKNGFESILIDGIAGGLSREDCFERLKFINPDMLFYEVSSPSINYDLHWIKHLKTILKTTKIIIGGTHDFSDVSILYDGIDGYIQGEYEFKLLDTCLLYDGRKDKDYTQIHDLDLLPTPDYEALNLNNYNDNPFGLPFPQLQYWSTRGCPYSCIFCAFPQIMYKGLPTYRMRSVENIINDLLKAKSLGIKSIYFDDDTFNIAKERTLKLIREFKDKINLPYAIMARADLMDFELLNELKKTGLHALKYGIESTNPSILKNIRKNLNISYAKQMIKLTKEFGINMHLTFMIGLPGDTIKTINDTINYAIDSGAISVQFTPLRIFKGTKIDNKDFKQYFSPERLEEMAKLAHHAFVNKIYNILN